MRHDRRIEKGAGSCELTEKWSTGARNLLPKRPIDKASHGCSALLRPRVV